MTTLEILLLCIIQIEMIFNLWKSESREITGYKDGHYHLYLVGLFIKLAILNFIGLFDYFSDWKISLVAIVFFLSFPYLLRETYMKIIKPIFPSN